MYQYGYYVAGEKVVLGTIGQSEFDGKQKEINWANKIDPGSRWFIEAAEHHAHLTPESLASSQAVVNASALEQSDGDTPPAQAQVA